MQAHEVWGLVDVSAPLSLMVSRVDPSSLDRQEARVVMRLALTMCLCQHTDHGHKGIEYSATDSNFPSHIKRTL